MKEKEMNALPDTQNERDHREILIDRVGVRELRYPAQYIGSGGERQATVAKYEMTVELPANLKGTHMSRFVEALHDFTEPLSASSVMDLASRLAEKLEAERAYVGCEFTIFREKFAPVSGLASKLDYELGIECHYSAKEANSILLSVQVPVATLCPCSKAISARGAHNQRGMVTISVEVEKSLCFEELIDLAEVSASCELYAGLKRVDEKAVTERAYDQPVFVEDLARNIAAGLKAHASIRWYRVEAENFESIHHHNAYAMIESR
jgi:GTP cyclohydrolase I